MPNTHHLGNGMATPIQAFIGDSLFGGRNAANDIDLYRFDVHTQSPTSRLTSFPRAPPAGTALNAHVRIFKADGVTVVPFTNSGGLGQAESAPSLPWRLARTMSAFRRKATTITFARWQRRHRRNSTGAIFDPSHLRRSAADARPTRSRSTIPASIRHRRRRARHRRRGTLMASQIGSQPPIPGPGIWRAIPARGDAPGDRDIPSKAT